MEHFVVYKREGFYSAFPLLNRLSDGRISIAFISSPFADHYGSHKLIVMISEDEGEKWRETDDSTIPFNWPGTTPRERCDRFACAMPDGSWLAAGGVGWEVWSSELKGKAEEHGLPVGKHPDGSKEKIIVGGHKLFVQRSQDQGKTWKRREWIVPGVSFLTSFPRSTILADGTILIPMFEGITESKKLGDWNPKYLTNQILRSGDDGETWRLIPVPGDPLQRCGSEMALCEVAPNRVIALIRASLLPGIDDHLLEIWSDDGGRSWSRPLRTEIRGHPPHLLLLSDGRLLCSYGFRHPPMGIRAVISYDRGQTWDVDRTIVLRDDGGTSSNLQETKDHPRSDIGYPVSIELSDGSILTAYYITLKDGITHIATTKWQLE